MSQPRRLFQPPPPNMHLFLLDGTVSCLNSGLFPVAVSWLAATSVLPCLARWDRMVLSEPAPVFPGSAATATHPRVVRQHNSCDEMGIPTPIKLRQYSIHSPHSPPHPTPHSFPSTMSFRGLIAALTVTLFSSTLFSSVAAINSGFPYGSQKVRGVSLGGWLLL